MFTAKCDGHLLYDLTKQIVLTSPKLHMGDNAAGSFEFEISPQHPLYNSLESMISEVVVYEDGDEIWSGRITEQKDDFFGMRTVYCEGELSYLCDTVQPQTELHYSGEDNVARWLAMLLSVHNSKAPADKRFELGICTVVEPDILYRYTNYETTLECIQDKLIDRLGGHLRIRKVNGVRKLDYLADYPGTADQTIRFGINLLEYSKTLTRADIATVCLPLGARLEERDYDILDKYLDVKDVNNGSIYVENAEAVNTFGRIIRVVHWDDVSTASALLRKAQEWVNNAQYDDLKLEVNALDFHMVDSQVRTIKLLDRVNVISPPHGLNRWFPVTEINIPLDNPSGVVFTLGTSERIALTSRTKKMISSLEDEMEYMPSAILLEARKNATELITTGALGGHVVVLPDEIYITDSPDITSADRMWRWNLNGLGYRKKKGEDFGLAMTMDGKIVADYITTGLMSADRIRGGILRLGGGAYKDGKLYMYNSSSKEIGHWDKDGLVVKLGTISGTKITGSTITGNTISGGTISGTTISGGTITGTKINGGTITGTTINVGGKNNKNGELLVRNDSGTVVGKWNKDGINILSGTIKSSTISGSTINGTEINGGTVSGSIIKGAKFQGANYYGNMETEIVIDITDEQVSPTLFASAACIYNRHRKSYGIFIAPKKQDGDGWGGVYNPNYSQIYTKSTPLFLCGYGDYGAVTGRSEILLGDRVSHWCVYKNSESFSEITLLRNGDIQVSALEGLYLWGKNVYLGATQKAYYNDKEIAVVSSSSIRYKHDIKPIEDKSLDPRKLLDLPVVQFRWNEDHTPQYKDMKDITVPGIIAEDVAEIYPAAVIHDDDKIESWDERRIIPGMLALIQEQEKRIATLERRFA